MYVLVKIYTCRYMYIKYKTNKSRTIEELIIKLNI